MKYTFQDSTELPVQRDFIRDMRDFMEACKQVLPVESAAIEKTEQVRETTASLQAKLEELTGIHEKMLQCIDSVIGNNDYDEIRNYRDSVIKTCDACAEKGKNDLKSMLDNVSKELDDEMAVIKRQILSMLNPLFEGGIYGAEKRYSAMQSIDGMKGVMTADLGPMEYQCDLTFDRPFVTLKYLMGSLFLPKWSKSGIIYKEAKVKMEDVSDFLLSTFDYDGKSRIETTFKSKKSDKVLKILHEGDELRVFLDDVEITADSMLVRSIKFEEINGLLTSTVDYVKSHIKSQRLTSLLLNGEDAILNTEVFDCLKLVAEQYSDIIRECLQRGYVEGEITIKMEQQDGTRTEKYLSKAEVFEELSELGSEGLEIASVLGLK
ncbi:hypothetical protein [Methanohalophilus sp.]|uniref:hypothetical protein n=1 Tax=Methanohalophilus sp. TaxID=1966352 RepID=UPI002620F926|nr:hypothetical protein [Methanohalophilus sp.]MDK2892615.1 hypothetical protein [Methanohalophilus sp.]